MKRGLLQGIISEEFIKCFSKKLEYFVIKEF